MLAWTTAAGAALAAALLAVWAARLRRRVRLLEAKNQRLRASVQGLAAASNARSRFLAMMSHEIRTPLTGIVGFAEVLSDEKLTPEGLHAAGNIQRASRSLQALLGDILDFSRIDAGALPMQQAPTDIEALLNEVRDEFAPQARQHGLGFGLTVAPEARRWALTDPLRLRQIVVNLVSNAIRYTEAGMVRIAAEAGPGQPDTIRISVTDTGIGIAPEDCKRIFDAFAQADSDAVQGGDGRGVGLGLAIADGLVRAMGGAISVESTLGHGSTFTVALPLQPCAPRPAAEAAPIAAAPVRPASILLVDDVEMNRELFAAMLKRGGHRVRTAEDGEAALRLLREDRFDLAFIDIQMPFIDGLELTRRIRANADPAIAALPIVALSAAAYGADRDRAQAAGMNDFVTKPATREDVAAAVMRIRSRTTEAGGAEPVPAAPTPAAIPADRPTSPPALDRSEFEQQRQTFGDERLVRFLGMLEAELRRRAAAIDDAAARDARSEIAQHSHAIASASGNLGFRYLMGLGRALERDVAGMSAEAFSASLEELRRAIADALAAIAAVSSEIGSPPSDRSSGR